MTRFRRSLGSSSPNARPAIVSYWPAAPYDAPPNAGDTTESMTTRVTWAFAEDAAISHAQATQGRRRNTSISLSQVP